MTVLVSGGGIRSRSTATLESQGSKAGSEPYPVTADFSPGETCIISEVRRLAEHQRKAEVLLSRLLLCHSHSQGSGLSETQSEGEADPLRKVSEAWDHAGLVQTATRSKEVTRRRSATARSSVSSLGSVPEVREGIEPDQEQPAEERLNSAGAPRRTRAGARVGHSASERSHVGPKKSQHPLVLDAIALTYKKSRAGGEAWEPTGPFNSPAAIVEERLHVTPTKSLAFDHKGSLMEGVEYDMLSQPSVTCHKTTGLAKDFFNEPTMKSTKSHASKKQSNIVAPQLPISWPSVLKSHYKAQIDKFGRSNAGIIACLQPEVPQSRSYVISSSEHSQSIGWSKFAEEYIIMSPDSSLRFAFNLVSLAVLPYDLTLVPYKLAWDVPFAPEVQLISGIIALFWTLEILLNFITGFFAKGMLITAPRRIARHYICTWFLIDFLIVFCDWISLIFMMFLQSDEKSAGLLRFAKLARLLRVPGMLRAVKFMRVLGEFLDRRVTEGVQFGIWLVCLLLTTIWFVHLVGCAWYGLGRYGPASTVSGLRWTDFSPDFDSETSFYQYTTSFHWSVSQITLGSVEISCRTSWERIFNIVCLLVGLLFGSTLVSSLSATMVQLQMMGKERNQKLSMLRRFLRENMVSITVARAVMHQATERLGERYKLTEKDVPVLALLSANLRKELRMEMFRPSLVTHPLFRLWCNVDAIMMRHVCASFCDLVFLTQADDLFVPGPARSEAYYFYQGAMEYIQEPYSAPVDWETQLEVPVRSWLCEAALWVEWIHVGRAEAQVPCRLLSIASGAIEEVMTMNHMARDVTVQYSKQFHKRVCSAQPPNSDFPSDLGVPFTDYGELVNSMGRELQVAIGMNALDQLGKGKGWSKPLNKLTDEIMKGKSIVTMNGDGDAERVVSVVALRIEHDFDRKILVQLGKSEGGGTEIQAQCQLPGGKQERDEMMPDAISRIAGSRLGPQTSCEVLHTERQVEWRESKEFGIKTKYLRTVCHSRLCSSLVTKPCLRRLRQSRVTDDGHKVRAGVPTHAASAQSPAHPGVLQTEVVAVQVAEDKYFFVAWVLPELFEHLSSPAGEQDLAALFGGLSFEPDAALDECEQSI